MTRAETAPADRLRTVLEEERQAILTGDFDCLEDLARAKTGLVAEIGAGEGVAVLTALRDRLLQQQRLIAGARDGMRSAAETAARRTGRLRTYGPAEGPGNSESPQDPAPPRMERRF